MCRINHFNTGCNMLVLVSYDIVNNTQRTKLAKKLGNYGERVQYSVFECNVNREQYKQMKKDVLEFVDLQKDSLRFYRMCRDCRRHLESFGLKRGAEEQDDKAIIV